MGQTDGRRYGRDMTPSVRKAMPPREPDVDRPTRRQLIAAFYGLDSDNRGHVQKHCDDAYGRESIFVKIDGEQRRVRCQEFARLFMGAGVFKRLVRDDAPMQHAAVQRGTVVAGTGKPSGAAGK